MRPWELLNIALINYEFPPIGGGAATATWHLAHHLAKLGHAPTVVTSRFGHLPKTEHTNGISIERIPTLRRAEDRSNIIEMLLFALSGVVRITSIIRRHHIDGLIVFFNIPCGPIGYWANKRTDAPYVVALRGGDVPGFEPTVSAIHRIVAPFRKRMLRRAWAVTANSRKLADLSQQTDPVDVTVIPNGVDSDYFGGEGAEGAYRNHKIYRFLFVGRLQAQKNVSVLIDSIANVKNTSPIPCELHIVGDGPLRGALENQVKHKKLEDLVVWHGWQGRQALRELYWSANCFVNPSHVEGMPNTVLEAMACGLPVIASDVGGNNELVVNESTGYLVPSESVAELADAMGRLLKIPDHGVILGQAGRERVTQYFTWAQVAQKYARLFQETTHNKNKESYT